MPYKCQQCNKDIAREDILRCSRCQSTIYCSKECQVKSWKTNHKASCNNLPSIIATRKRALKNNQPATSKAGDVPKIDTPIGKKSIMSRQLDHWMQLWKAPLQIFGVMSLDLPKYPKERVTTHCLQVSVRYDKNVEDPAKAFIPVQASVVQITNLGPELPQILKSVNHTDFDQLRLVVFVVNERKEKLMARVLTWHDFKIDRYWRGMSQDRSEHIALTWRKSLFYGFTKFTPQQLEKGLSINKKDPPPQLSDTTSS